MRPESGRIGSPATWSGSSANSIRATHRSEFGRAAELLTAARRIVEDIERTLSREYPSVYYAGFVEDGQKEYVEASAMLAFAQGTPLPTPAGAGSRTTRHT